MGEVGAWSEEPAMLLVLRSFGQAISTRSASPRPHTEQSLCTITALVCLSRVLVTNSERH